MDKKVIYIGEHPSEFGGITKKSEILYNQMRKFHPVDLISINVKNKKKISFLIAVISMILKVNKKVNVMYCIDSYRLYALLKLQRVFHPKTISNTIIVISGGDVSRIDVAKKDGLIEIFGNSKGVWVESERLKIVLEQNGIKNCLVYPNPRDIDVVIPPTPTKENNIIKLLYYSLISEEKGAIDTIQAVQKLNELNQIQFTIDFYGSITDKICDRFKAFIDQTPNANYCGFNDSKDIRKYYETISTHDIFIFPTHWKGEGVAGVCVEAKATGLAIIASDHNVNREIVRESNKEGIIIEEGNIDQLVNSILRLAKDEKLLMEIKNASFESRLRYDVKEYQSLYENCFI